jgi:SAM-dependent MidA family methyltransferase
MQAAAECEVIFARALRCWFAQQVEQVKRLRLVEVGPGEDQLFRTWNDLILTEYPLKDCRLVGRQFI